MNRMMSAHENSSDVSSAESGILAQFFSRAFFHYLWTGGALALVQIALLWLFIDIFRIPTLISSSVVVVGLLVLRFGMLRWLRVIS